MNNQLVTFKVKDWVVFGRTIFQPPHKISDALINEARIVYVVNGESKLYSANQYSELRSGDLLIMKTDNFINNWQMNKDSQLNEVIAFQLNSEFLKHLYHGNRFNATDYIFQEVIQQNLYEDLNIEDLAFLTGMSLSSFKRKFSSVFGTTPNKYITSKRLEKAQNLLATSQMNIAEIAYECGFSDVGYFSKTFRKYYNGSPSDLRKSPLN